MQTVKPEDLAPVAKEIEMLFDGDLAAVAKRLDEVLYMLFFLKPESFSAEEVELTAYQLRHLRDAFGNVG